MQLMRKLSIKTPLLPLCAAAFTCFLIAPAQAAWEPTRPVEFVVPAGAGGASDQMTRLIQSIVVKHKLMKQPMIIQIKSAPAAPKARWTCRIPKATRTRFSSRFP